jgi:hypothetical protein
MKNIVLSLVLACGVLLAEFAPAQTIPSTLFGLHQNEGSMNNGPMPLVSVGAYRWWDIDGCTWATIETSSGTYNWSCSDNWVSKLNSAGITDFIFTFGYTPPWAAPQGGGNGGQYGSCHPPLLGGNSPTGSSPYYNYDSATMKAFATAIATRYNGQNGHGLITHYETWNEPGSGNPFWCRSNRTCTMPFSLRIPLP